MVFYQSTLKEITLDTIKDSVFRGHTPTYLHFNFIDYPNIKTFDEAFGIIETKRKTLLTPNTHGIMNIVLDYPEDTSTETMIKSTDSAARGFYNHFNQDLFIISMIFKDNDNYIRSYVTICDIEKSLPETSQNRLPEELIIEIINNSIENANIKEFYQDSLYLYNAESESLAYDGVFHLRCKITS